MRLATVILACCVLVGCAGRPVGVLTPVDASVPNAARVELLVATTRAPSRDQGILFTGEREHFGHVVDETAESATGP
jgi:esterase/lipase superfamily enzyme